MFKMLSFYFILLLLFTDLNEETFDCVKEFFFLSVQIQKLFSELLQKLNFF